MRSQAAWRTRARLRAFVECARVVRIDTDDELGMRCAMLRRRGVSVSDMCECARARLSRDCDCGGVCCGCMESGDDDSSASSSTTASRTVACRNVRHRQPQTPLDNALGSSLRAHRTHSHRTPHTQPLEIKVRCAIQHLWRQKHSARA